MATSSIRLPYGVYDFKKIREKAMFFVDNTEVIKLLEAGRDHVLLCRPPRFGKSLLLSMLSMYYDEQQASLFEKLFGDLWIGKNPTGNQNKYKVLHVDFSVHAGENDPMERVNELFQNRINRAVKDFRERYEMSFEVNDSDFADSLGAMGTALKKTSSRLLVLIDEYDRWANQILMDGDVLRSSKDMRQKLVPLCGLFQCVKSLQMQHLDFRTVIVGVSVLPLADISGWNIDADLTHEKVFATAIGFTEVGVISALQALDVSAEDQPALVHLLHIFFNGFDFAGCGSTVFNPVQIIFFCECYREKKLDDFIRNVATCDTWSPEQCYNFIMACADRHLMPGETVFDVIAESEHCNFEVLNSLKSDSAAKPKLPRSFRLHDMNSETGLLRCMLHHGIVTLASADATFFELRLPNLLVRRQHWEALMKRLEKDKDLLGSFLRAPSADKLKQLLDLIVAGWETPIYSSQLNETSLQLGFESALREMCSACRVRGAKVRAHVLSETREIDLLLLLPEGHQMIIIELKRLIRLDIDLGDAFKCAQVVRSGAHAAGEGERTEEARNAAGDDKASARNQKEREMRAGDKKGREVVVMMSGDNLRALKLTSSFQGKPGNAKLLTVENLLTSAKDQTQLQEEALRRDPVFAAQYTKFYRFAVVQVIEPLVVEPAK